MPSQLETAFCCWNLISIILSLWLQLCNLINCGIIWPKEIQWLVTLYRETDIQSLMYILNCSCIYRLTAWTNKYFLPSPRLAVRCRRPRLFPIIQISVTKRSGQKAGHHLYPSDVLIHLRSQSDIHACILHLANVPLLGLFITTALDVMSLPSNLAR